ncbi:hypothetical protein [Pseudobacteroides cellulosolvens]|nr:hypothetical protein [Pseudobacteroides cellulosolvens]
MRGKNTKKELVGILVFKRAARVISFNTGGEDFKNKEQVNELEVCIAVRI